jgi:hypothetical protein
LESEREFFERLPTIIFHLDNKFDFEWAPAEYLYVSGPEVYCLAMD